MDPEQPAPYGGNEAPDKEKMEQVRIDASPRHSSQGGEWSRKLTNVPLRSARVD